MSKSEKVGLCKNLSWYSAYLFGGGGGKREVLRGLSRYLNHQKSVIAETCNRVQTYVWLSILLRAYVGTYEYLYLW